MIDIDIDNLKHFIINYTELHSTIIYFGIGSKFYPSNTQSGWDSKLNQQFPTFLHDAKLKYFDKNILIILIDPGFDLNQSPYIVSSQDNFLSNSWTKSDTHTNLYVSEMGVSVIVLKQFIGWNSYNYKSPEYSQFINIEPMLLELCEYISRPTVDSLLFYHEFTGHNVLVLENSIKTQCVEFGIGYDETKICIDITRGADLSCYFNFTNPENYPIIIIDENINKLKYLNPSTIWIQNSTEIINKYKKFNLESNSKNYSSSSNSKSNPDNISTICPFNKYDTNYLYDKPNDLVLYFQIVKSDLISFMLIKNSIISLIRQFYTMENKKKFGIGMWGVNFFSILKSKVITINFDSIEDKLRLIDSINSCSDEIPNYNEIFDLTKNQILDDLYHILSISLKTLLVKYRINDADIDDFIEKIKNIQNKYDIIKFYENFIDQVLYN